MLLDGNREIDAETKHKLSATTQQRCIVVVLVLLLGVIYFPDFLHYRYSNEAMMISPIPIYLME